MADIITYPENGITYDADDASGYLATRLSGVYSAEEDFSVTAQGGLSIQVSAGQAWVRPARFKGRSIIMEQPTTVVLTDADPVRSRIDRVVLRYDAAAKKTRLQVLDGTPDSAAPAAPAISRTELVYDLCLAEIRRPAGSTSVTAADITDTRADETVCGVMRDGVTGIPAATLIQRLRAEIDKLVDKDSFYNKAETDAMLDELQEQVSKMGASGQPIAVWSYYASFSSLKSYKYSIPNSVDYIVVKKDPNEAGSQISIPRGKTGVIGYFSITLAKDGTLSLYADAPSGHTLYFVGYHYLTAADGVKFPYLTIENSYLGLSEASTNAERKTALVKYFTDRPCQVVYRIATPIETPVTPDEIAAYKALTTYAPDTVVQAGDGAGVKLEYQRDVNLVVKNLEDAIASMTTT